jgi:L-phenylalanine/L-methionine N-acetyltransferase
LAALIGGIREVVVCIAGCMADYKEWFFVEIFIRRAEPSDAADLMKCYTAPRVVHNTLQLPYRSVESVRQQLARYGEGDIVLVAVGGNEVIASIGLHTVARARLRHKGEIVLMVRDDWQGKGVGSSLMEAILDLADQWLNLARLELTVYVDNAAAVRLYQKFGFEIEGTLRNYSFRNGSYVDVYTMARLKES